MIVEYCFFSLIYLQINVLNNEKWCRWCIVWLKKKKKKSVREKNQFPKERSQSKSDCDIEADIGLKNAVQPN